LAPVVGNAVTVNGVSLSNAQLQKELNQAMAMQQVPPQYREMASQQLGQRIKEGFINRTLLTQAATKQGLTTTPEDIQKEVDTMLGTLPPNVTFEMALESASMTEEDFRAKIKEDLLVRKMVDVKKSSLPEVTDAEAKEYYEASKEKFETKKSAKARHILIKTQGDDDAAKAEKLKKLEKIRAQLAEGGDFAELAKEYSDCPSGQNGGDLGTFSPGQMVPSFDKAAFSQDLNMVGQVVETSFGYHIIEVTDRNDGGVKAFDEIKEDVKGTISNEKMGKLMDGFLTELREKAEIHP